MGPVAQYRIFVAPVPTGIEVVNVKPLEDSTPKLMNILVPTEATGIESQNGITTTPVVVVNDTGKVTLVCPFVIVPQNDIIGASFVDTHGLRPAKVMLLATVMLFAAVMSFATANVSRIPTLYKDCEVPVTNVLSFEILANRPSAHVMVAGPSAVTKMLEFNHPIQSCTFVVPLAANLAREFVLY